MFWQMASFGLLQYHDRIAGRTEVSKRHFKAEYLMNLAMAEILLVLLPCEYLSLFWLLFILK